MTVANLHHLDQIDATGNWLGHVLWFTISEANVSRTTLVDLFDRHGVDHDWLPPQITALDAYRRVTGKVREEYTASNGNTVRLLVRDVATEPELVTRHFVREEVDAAGKSLSYTEVGSATFARPGTLAGTRDGQAAFKVYDWRLPADEVVKVTEIVDRVTGQYLSALELYDSQAVRGVIRRYIVAQRAIAVRPSGGVYFVHGAHSEALAKIQRVVKDLPGGSTLHALPLVDDVEQRQMLADAYAAEVTDEVEGLLRDIAEAVEKYVAAGIPVPKRTRESLGERLAEAMARAQEHDARLNLVSDQSRAALSAAFDAITRLAGAA